MWKNIRTVDFYWHHIVIFIAYQALTDDEARRNWEKYGNPDGPGAMSFGIALPSWIVEKENSVWVCKKNDTNNCQYVQHLFLF